jgi:hypothetical protein
LAARVPRMAPARLTTADMLLAIRACSDPATSRAEVRARFIAAVSALALLRKPVTAAVTARLSSTSAVAAAQILPFNESDMPNRERVGDVDEVENALLILLILIT